MSKKQPLSCRTSWESPTCRKLSLAGVIVVGFIVGFVMGHAKVPHNPNEPKYEVALGRDPDGVSVVAVRGWRDTNSAWTPVYRTSNP